MHKIFKTVFIKTYQFGRWVLFLPATRNISYSRQIFITIFSRSLLILPIILGLSAQLLYFTRGLLRTSIATIIDILLTALATVSSFMAALFFRHTTVSAVLEHIRGPATLSQKVFRAVLDTLRQTQIEILAARPEMRPAEYVFYKIFFAPSLMFLAPLRPRPPEGDPAFEHEEPVEPLLQAPENRANSLIATVYELRQHTDTAENILIDARVYRAIIALIHDNEIAENQIINTILERQLENDFFRIYHFLGLMQLNFPERDFQTLSKMEKYFYYARIAQEVFEHSAEWLSAIISKSIPLNESILERNDFSALEIANVTFFHWIASYLHDIHEPEEHHQEKILVLHQMRLSFINFLEKLKILRENSPENEPLEVGIIIPADNNRRAFVKLNIYALVYRQLQTNRQLREGVYSTALFLKLFLARQGPRSETPIQNIARVCFTDATPIDYFAAIKSALEPKALYSTDIYYLKNSIKKRIEILAVHSLFFSMGSAILQLASNRHMSPSIVIKSVLSIIALLHISKKNIEGYKYPDSFIGICPSLIKKLMPFITDLRNPDICYEASLWRFSAVFFIPCRYLLVNNDSKTEFMINIATMYHITYFLSKIRLPAFDKKQVALDSTDIRSFISDQLRFGVYGAMIKKILTQSRTSFSRMQTLDGFSNTLLLLAAHFALERYRSSNSIMAAMKIAFKMIFIWGPILQLMSQSERYIAGTRTAREALHSIEPLAQYETTPILELAPALPIVSFTSKWLTDAAETPQAGVGARLN